jgi:hypothetical protein
MKTKTKQPNLMNSHKQKTSSENQIDGTILQKLGLPAVGLETRREASPSFAPGIPIAVNSYNIRAHRIFTRLFHFKGATRFSGAVASLSEIGRTSQSGGLDFPFIGDATMKVYNVSPTDNFVWVRGEIDWDSDLDIQVTIFVA